MSTITIADVIRHCESNNIPITVLRDRDEAGDPCIDAMGVIMEQVYDHAGVPMAIQWEYKGFFSLATTLQELLDVADGRPVKESTLPKDFSLPTR